MCKRNLKEFSNANSFWFSFALLPKVQHKYMRLPGLLCPSHNIVNKGAMAIKPDTFALLYIFAIVFGLDPAQATIGLEKCWKI